jgi:hypothetical protein
MRKLRQLSMTVVFALMLANGAFAGSIGTPPEPPSTTEPGSIGTGPSDQAVVAPSDPVASIALILLQTVLSAI